MLLLPNQPIMLGSRASMPPSKAELRAANAQDKHDMRAGPALCLLAL